MWTIILLTKLLLIGYIFADKLCPDEKMSCPESKACCLVEGQYECCTTKIGEHQLPIQKDDIFANNSNPIEAAVPNSGGCLTNSDCMRFQTCCPAGVCCTVGSQCCGDQCCPSNSRCCPNEKVCCQHNKACCEDQGCCPMGFPCCKGKCCPFLSKCCSSGCSPVGYKCCGDGMCGLASKCCNSDLGSWCCSQTLNCRRTYQTCGATGVVLSPVVVLLTLIAIKLKGFL